MAHTRFRFDWNWDGREAVLQSRCTDETGYVQPTRNQLIAARGTKSSYHYNGIQSWKVLSDGTVRNVHV
jgi:sulfane dehydrogenase subunit SoxC